MFDFFFMRNTTFPVFYNYASTKLEFKVCTKYIRNLNAVFLMRLYFEYNLPRIFHSK